MGRMITRRKAVLWAAGAGALLLILLSLTYCLAFLPTLLSAGEPGFRWDYNAHTRRMVVTAVDRDILGTGIEMEFFGRRARIPTGPAALALRHGTPLLPVTVFRLPDDTYQAIGYEPIIAQSSGDRKADERRITGQLVRRMEQVIREHPEQWHLPHAIFEGAR